MRVVAAALCAFLGACALEDGTPAGPEGPWLGEAHLLEEGARYLDDATFRREALLASLQSHDNAYARERIDSYGLQTSGWDLLPVWAPRSVPIDAALASRLAGGERLALPAGEPPLWDGTRPATLDGWVALGREVFFRYPLRADPALERAVRDAALGDRVGVLRSGDGSVPGPAVYEDLDGAVRIGVTCALCHTDVREGEVVAGAARRRLDVGAMRLAFHEATGEPLEPELARLYASWGPGRADITADDAEDPVAIPDLWGIAAQSSLTQGGTIRHTGPAALAIRQETQLLQAGGRRARPPRELAFALAAFVYSLRPPPPPAAPDDALALRGEEIFDAACRRCHANAAYGGPLVPLEEVGTDPALALGRTRGTGSYRPPALLRVGDAAPYFHHGAVPTLPDLFSTDRFSPGYDRSPIGPGPVPGHPFGTELDRPDRSALLAFLRSL